MNVDVGVNGKVDDFMVIREAKGDGDGDGDGEGEGDGEREGN